MKTQYYKSYQRDELWNYYKLMSDRNPPACEVVNFLGTRPAVEIREYNLNSPGSKIDFDAFREVGVAIPAQEYEEAYRRATADTFGVYINGQPQPNQLMP